MDDASDAVGREPIHVVHADSVVTYANEPASDVLDVDAAAFLEADVFAAVP